MMRVREGCFDIVFWASLKFFHLTVLSILMLGINLLVSDSAKTASFWT